MRASLCAAIAMALVAATLQHEGAIYGGDEKAACIASLEKSQQLRDDGKLIQARVQMLSCARDVCPGEIRKDCSTWLTALDTTLPSIVIGAEDADHRDLIKVKVTVDGQPFLDSLNGKALPIDPGPHAFKFEADGQKPLERSILVREGEQHRTINVQFETTAPTAVTHAPPPPLAPSSTPSAPPAAQSAPIPTAAYILGGVGILALGGFAGFAIKGTSDLSGLRNGCGATRSCAQSDVDGARTTLRIGDVSLGVSIVALGVATYLVLSRGAASAAKSTGSAHWELAPVAGGAGAALRF